MRHFLLFYLLSVVSLVFGQTGYFYPSERFSSGLINDVCQDQHGYIWIATENGLNKFDGYRFTTYLHQPDDAATLNSNIVVKLYNDSKGQLWVGTRIGLSCYDESSDRFVNYILHIIRKRYKLFIVKLRARIKKGGMESVRLLTEK